MKLDFDKWLKETTYQITNHPDGHMTAVCKTYYKGQLICSIFGVAASDTVRKITNKHETNVRRWKNG